MSQQHSKTGNIWGTVLTLELKFNTNGFGYVHITHDVSIPSAHILKQLMH